MTHDHIKTLAVNARLAYEDDGLLYPSIGECCDMTPELTAFAQAVAMECAEIAASAPRVWDLDAPAPQARIASDIRARFGLGLTE